jgi:hypothetical protein
VGFGYTVTGTLTQASGRSPQVFPMTVTGSITADRVECAGDLPAAAAGRRHPEERLRVRIRAFGGRSQCLEREGGHRAVRPRAAQCLGQLQAVSLRTCRPT